MCTIALMSHVSCPSPFQLELMAIELLKRGADPNKERGTGGSTPLHLAVAEEELELVKMLLKKGARLENMNDYGCTPFLEAVKYVASEEIVDLLLEHGADVHTLTEDRKTALHFAAQKNDEVTMRKMIERGLSVGAEDKDGCTPLHEAVHYGSKGAAEVLTEKGQSLVFYDINLPNLPPVVLLSCIVNVCLRGAQS